MPAFLLSLLGGLIGSLGTITGRVLVSLGIGLVTYQGFDSGMTYLKSRIVASVGSLGQQSIAVLGGCEVGAAINIVLSAMLIRLLIDGLTSGSIKKMVQK